MKRANGTARSPARRQPGPTSGQANERRAVGPASSEKGLRRLFEWVPVGVIRTTPHGQILEVNTALVRMLRYPNGRALRARNAKDLCANASDYGRWQAQLRRHGFVRRFDIALRRFDGRLVWVLASARVLRKRGGSVRWYEGLMLEVRRSTRHLRTAEALRRLNENVERQAKAISQALHDEAGQLLTAAHIALAEAVRDLAPPARRLLDEVKQHLDRVEEQLRGLAHELRPRILDDLGLIPALQFLAAGVAKRRSINVMVDARLRDRLPHPVETAVYRLAQEALTNISRHALATTVTIRLNQPARTVRCTIADDGVGFDASAVLAQGRGSGLGLAGIRDRVTALGGTFRVQSAAGHGTRLIVNIPVET